MTEDPNLYRIEELMEIARRIKLPDYEKTRVRQKLIQFMDKNPIGRVDRRVGRKGYLIAEIIQSRFSNLGRLSFPIQVTGIILTAMIVVSGSVSFAAQNSLPGDRLYPIKFYLNENIEGYFAISDKSKAQFELERVERRLNEIERLAADGKITANTQLSIQANLDSHLNQLETHLDDIRANQNSELALDISGSLETSLNTHRDIIGIINQQTDSRESILGPFEIHLSSISQETSNSRLSDELSLRQKYSAELKNSAEAKVSLAQRSIARGLDKTLRLSNQLNDSTQAQIDAYLNEAQQLEAKARLSLRLKEYSEAIIFAQGCLNIVTQVEIILSAQTTILNTNSPLPIDLSPVPTLIDENVLPQPSKVMKLNGL